MKQITLFFALISLLSENIQAQCTPILAPWIDNVETHATSTNISTSNCWTVNATTSYDWNIDGFGSTPSNNTGPLGAFSGTNYFYTEASASNPGTVAELVSPVIDLTPLTIPFLEFYYHMHGDQMGNLFVDISNGATWTTVDSLIGEQQTNQAAPWLKKIINLSAYSGNIQIRFRAISSGSFEGDISIDDILVEETPTCPQPGTLNVSNLLANSADLGWIENGTATNWEVEYGSAGFNPGTGTKINTLTNPHPLTGLVGNTNYDFYVRSICSAGDTSLLAGPTSFLTPCGTFLAPFIENIESHSPTTALGFSQCWNASATGTYDWNIDGNGSTPTANTGPLAAFSGTNYFYTEASFTNNGEEATLLSPVIDISALTIPILEFRYHMFGVNMGDLFIDILDAGLWTPVDSIFGQQQATATDPWLKRVINLSTFSGSIQVRFRAINRGITTGDISLDNINIIEMPTCNDPNSLNVTNLLANSVDLGWTETGTATHWQIEYAPSGFTPGNGTLVSTTTNPHSLNGLIDNTAYQFYVRSICSIGDTSLWVGPFAFITPCVSILAPWLDDLETHTPSTAFGFSNCWNASASSGYDWNITGNGTTPSLATGANSAFSGTNYFYTEASTSNPGTVAELVSPVIDLTPLTIPFLEFYYHMHGDQMGNLFVDISNGVTWTTVDSLIGEQQTNQTDPWLKKIINLSAYSGNIQIRFRAISNGSFEGDISLDNIQIMEAPSCSEPTALNVTNLLANSVDLGWTENGSATNWAIEWGPAGFTQGNGTIVNTMNNPFNLTGLTNTSSYSFFVRSVCGAGDTSSWSGSFSFLTPCATEIAPFTDDVETHTATTNLTFSQCWSSSSGDYTWDISGTGTTPSNNTGPSSAFSGSNFFFTEASMGVLGDIAELISPNIDISALVLPILEFRYHMFGGNINRLFIDISDGAVWTTVDSIVGQQQTSQTDVWLKRTVDLSSFTGVIQVRFRAISNGTFEGDISIDNINVIATPTCPEPTFLSATNVTANTVNLTWTENGSANNWQIEWGPTGFTPGTGTYTNTSFNPFILSGLSPFTSYSFYLRSICGIGDTSLFVGPVSFQTICGPIMAPWSDNIDTHTPTITLSSSNCWNASATTGYDWNINGMGPTPSANTGPSGAHSGTNYFYTEASGSSIGDVANLISPEIDVTGIAPVLEFRYHMFGGDMGNLFIDVFDGIVWTTVDSIVGQVQTTQADTFLIDTVELTAFTGVIQVRFRAVSNGSFEGDISLDNIEIKQSSINSCIAPSALNVTNITANSANLEWTENGSATLWEIQWGELGGSLITVPTGVNPYNLTNLNDTTDYCFSVTSICSFTDSSMTIGPECFTTLLSTGIDENPTNVNLSIYPNPNEGIFTLNVNTTDANELDIKVTNLQGQVVFSKANFENVVDVNQIIDLTDNAKGIYFVTVTSDKGVATNKIVVQ